MKRRGFSREWKTAWDRLTAGKLIVGVSGDKDWDKIYCMMQLTDMQHGKNDEVYSLTLENLLLVFFSFCRLRLIIISVYLCLLGLFR